MPDPQGISTEDPVTSVILFILDKAGEAMARKSFGDKWVDVLESAKSRNVEITIALPATDVTGYVDHLNDDASLVIIQAGNSKWTVGLDFILAISGHDPQHP